MGKIIAIAFTIIITSFYFFPFEFVFLPEVNTKMAMAGFGLVLLLMKLARQREPKINRDFFQLALWATGVSLAGLLSVVYNNTHDYTYATYLVSMLVWCSGAYMLVSLIRWVHGKVSVIVVCNYLITVCVLQCFLALLIDNSPAFKQLVDQVVLGVSFTDMEMLRKLGRLYGIGASLDVAGCRFAAILVMIAFIMMRIAEQANRKILGVYLIAFLVITLIGNMMSRSTTVGMILALLYVAYESRFYILSFSKSSRRLLGWLIVGLAVLLPIVIYKYHTDTNFYGNIRFAFEGFFSLAEKGTWEVHSNEILKNMYVFPDNLKTWIIGDGYFDNPYYKEPYYTGLNWKGYYQETDVGYLRFIFYFGVIGLLLFCIFIIRIGQNCMSRFTGYKKFFLMLIMLNFIIWLKVSTDIFLVFAPFLMIRKEENEDYERLYLTDV